MPAPPHIPQMMFVRSLLRKLAKVLAVQLDDLAGGVPE